MPVLLEFEEPIGELLEQLEKAKEISEKGDVDTTKTVRDIERKIKQKREEIYKNLTPWQRVQVSRHPERPYTLSYIKYLTNKTFVELHGDRTVGDDKAMVGGFGKIDGQSYMLIGQQKGDRKSTRLNSSHVRISYAVFCLKKKK